MPRSTQGSAKEPEVIAPIEDDHMEQLGQCLDTITVHESNLAKSYALLGDALAESGITTMKELKRHKDQKAELVERYVAARTVLKPGTKYNSHVKYLHEMLKKIFAQLVKPPPSAEPCAGGVYVQKWRTVLAVNASGTEEEVGEMYTEDVAFPYPTGVTLHVRLPHPLPEVVTRLSALFQSLPSTKSGVNTEKHAWGEFSPASLYKIWYVISQVVDVTSEDIVADWGAGAGAQLIAVYIFVRHFYPSLLKTLSMVGIEMDEAAFTALVHNMETILPRHVRDPEDPPRFTLLNGDSQTLGDFGPRTSMMMQYDGAPQKWEFVEPYFKIIARKTFSQIGLKVILSTKMNPLTYKKMFSGCYGDPKVHVGVWKHYKLAGMSQGGSSFNAHLYIRDDQRDVPSEDRKKVEDWKGDGQTEGLVEQVLAAKAAKAAKAAAAAAAAAAVEANPELRVWCTKPGCPLKRLHSHSKRPPQPKTFLVQERQAEESEKRDVKRRKTSSSKKAVSAVVHALATQDVGGLHTALKATLSARDFDALAKLMAAKDA
jgi:hypothetical protein